MIEPDPAHPLWFFSKDGTACGPMPFAELRAQARAGNLTPHDAVLREGTAEWIPASSVEDLFPVGVKPPPVLRPANAFDFVEPADERRRPLAAEGGNHGKWLARLGLVAIAVTVLMGCILCGCLQSILRNRT